MVFLVALSIVMRTLADTLVVCREKVLNKLIGRVLFLKKYD